MIAAAALALACASGAAAEPGDAAVPAQEFLWLGPLAAPAALFDGAPGAERPESVPELDPEATWPAAGDALACAPGVAAAWLHVDLDGEPFALAAERGPVVDWLACYATFDRFARARIEVTAPAAPELWIDGARAAVGAERTFRTGTHRILLRIARPEGSAGAVAIALRPSAPVPDVSWSTEPRRAFADYAESQRFHGLTGLALAPDGRLLALSHRLPAPAGKPGASRLDLLDAETGATVVPGLAGPGASAVGWSRDGTALLLRQGDSLHVWNRRDGALRELLRDEPGLGSAALAPDGRTVVFVSARGAAPEPGEKQPRRLTELREKLTDWPRRPHLHALMVDSGVRRRLAVPGDWSTDAFAFLPDSSTIVVFVSVPKAERPWFETEVRTLDLASGRSRLVAVLAMGFENRPGLNPIAVAPDGTRVAFTAPPGVLGAAAPREVNAFDPDLYVLTLADGAWWKVTEEFRGAATGAIAWTPDSAAIDFVATVGARAVGCRAALAAGAARAEIAELPQAVDVIAAWSRSLDGTRRAYVGSDAAHLPALYVGPADGGASRRLLAPHDALERELALATPVDASFPLRGRTRIEAWLYRPVELSPRDPPAKLPLVVSFYGGATPTLRGFNDLHQYLAGNGYAVLCVNPRGAHGYGDAFADSHVNDWGERAGADVLAAIDAVLQAHPDLDPARIGCYGGSYGGFLTQWLIAHSDRFRAASSLYGIADVAAYFGEGTWGYTYGDQSLAANYPWRSPDWFVEHSPYYRADAIHTPLLLLHGDADTNVPPGESLRMFTALRLLGRDVELVRFPGEDHGLRGTPENRIAHREMLCDWFDRWLKEQPEAWQARFAE